MKTYDHGTLSEEERASLLAKLANWLGDDGCGFFIRIKEKYGGLNVDIAGPKSPMPHPVHFREGMRVRNFLRKQPECSDWTDHDFDNRWIELVEAAIVKWAAEGL